MHYNVERECNVFLRVKVTDQDSQFQSTRIPIPRHAPLDVDSITFVGRLGKYCNITLSYCEACSSKN